MSVAIIGGGIAGLAAAWELSRQQMPVQVFEASPRLGGCLAPLELGGCTIDAGAESFAVRGGVMEEFLTEVAAAAPKAAAILAAAMPAAEVAASLEDANSLASEAPAPAAGSLFNDKGLFDLPRTGILGIPEQPLAREVARIIGWPAAFRAYLDRVLPLFTADNNLGRLVERRMGRTVLDTLIAPVIRGVYSTDPHNLDLERIWPGFQQEVLRAGSLAVAAGRMRASSEAVGSAVRSIRGGMHRLPAELSRQISAGGGQLRLNSPVRQLAANPDGGWLVRTPDKEHPAQQVLLAVPRQETVRLISTAGDYEPPPSPPPHRVELAFLVIDQPNLRSIGSGALINSRRIAAKSLTHVNAKWPWVQQLLPPNRHILRLSYSGLSGSLLAQATADAAAIFGENWSPDQVQDFRQVSWERSVSEKRAAFANLPFGFAGAWLDGPGLSATISQARRAARKLVTFDSEY